MSKRRNYVYDPKLQDWLYKERKRFDKKRENLVGQLYKRDGKRCANCGTDTNLTVDHIIPLSRWGTNDLDNLQILCLSCNCKKGVY